MRATLLSVDENYQTCSCCMCSTCKLQPQVPDSGQFASKCEELDYDEPSNNMMNEVKALSTDMKQEMMNKIKELSNKGIGKKQEMMNKIKELSNKRAGTKQDMMNKIKELSNRGADNKKHEDKDFCFMNNPLLSHGKQKVSAKVRTLKGFKLDEADDDSEPEHDWENDPRMSPVLCGDNMEGPDTGCTPIHILHLPRPIKQPRNYGIYGRSLLTVHNQPTFAEVRPRPSRCIVQNKEFLGWSNIKKASKQCSRKNALWKGKIASKGPAFSLE